MFYGKREEVLNALEKLRVKQCAYTAKGRSRCDCKYGFATAKEGYSEITGCPELRTAIELINAMTEDEYKAMLNRHAHTPQIAHFEKSVVTPSLNEKVEALNKRVEELSAALLELRSRRTRRKKA